ncbi:MAG: cohesin domain-containing protein [Thermodesulfobacteriota bacterium]
MEKYMLRFVLIRALVVFFLICAYANAAGLSISDKKGAIGELVTFNVSANDAPTPVKAFTFFLAYDPNVLRYQGYQQNELTDNCDIFLVNDNSSGVVKVLGVASEGMIKEGDSGGMLQLDFQVVGSGDIEIGFTAVKDDMKTWDTKNGRFIGEAGQVQDGENNENDSEDHSINENVNAEEATNVEAEIENIQDESEEELNQDLLEDSYSSSTETLSNSVTTSAETIEEKEKILKRTQSDSNTSSSTLGRIKKKGAFSLPNKKDCLTITDKPITANQKKNTIKTDVQAVQAPQKKRSEKSVKELCCPDKTTETIYPILLVLLFCVLGLQIIVLIKLSVLGKKLK